MISFILSKMDVSTRFLLYTKGKTLASSSIFLLFHYLLVYPIAGANIALDCLTDFLLVLLLFSSTPNKVKPNVYRCSSSNQHHEIAAWEL